MLNIFISILGMIITIVLVIGVHECGHFTAARLCGVKIHRFSIGFGKTLFHWYDKKGTEYVIAAIPLGGYVKMLDENEDDVPPKELPYAFNRQPLYKKFFIVAAGPVINIVFAFVVYWLLFCIGFSTIKPITGTITPHSIAAQAGLTSQQEIIKIDSEPTPSWAKAMLHIIMRAGDHGTMQIEAQAFKSSEIKTYSLNLSQWKMDDLKPDPFESLGIKPYEPVIEPIIQTVATNSPASHSGLKSGDKILAINNKPITDWMDMLEMIGRSPDTILHFQVIRNNKKINLPVTIGSKHRWFLSKYGFLGVTPHFIWQPELINRNQYNPVIALTYAAQETGDFIHLNIILLGKLITGKISFHSLGGPITIFESAGTALNQGFIPFLGFLAFLSISIGFVNILPIPGLDGGHMLFQLIEATTRRPLSLRTQELFYRFGLIILFMLIIQALANDIMRL